MNRKGINYTLVFLLCLPLLFINIKHSHDWGDDFAQYLHQTKNICQGTPQLQSGYIYNPEFILGPPAYPSGFPMLLAPVYSTWGLSFVHFDLYMSLYLLALALLLFAFLNRYFSSLISILAVLLFVYNPWTLNFKMEIMSDLPFAVLLISCFLIYERSEKKGVLYFLSLALLSGILVCVRNAGFAFLVAILMDAGIKTVRKLLPVKQLVLTFLIFVLSFLIYLTINNWLFPTVDKGLFSYHFTYPGAQQKHYVLENIHYNMAVFRAFFEPSNNQWGFVSIICGSLVFTFTVLGFIKRIAERFGFIELTVLLYFSVVAVYPISNAGFRFILPVAPFLLYYAITGLYCIHIPLGPVLKPACLPFLLFALIFFSYSNGLSEAVLNRNKELNGPQEKESVEAFNYIIEHTPDSSRFNFIKPRALSLYTGRRAMSHRPLQNLSEIQNSFTKNQIEYILVNDEISDDSLKYFVKSRSSELDLIWSNPKFKLYKRTFFYIPSTIEGIRKLENDIVNTHDWRELVRKKAMERKMPVDSMIYMDAKYLYDSKKGL